MNQYETWNGPRKEDVGSVGRQEKEKGKFPSFRFSSEIKKSIDLGKVLEEQILDSRVELTMREVLAITKKEFHNIIIELVKRKQLSMGLEMERPVKVKADHVEEVALEEEFPDIYYTWPHWARAMIETPVRIGDVKEPVVALIDLGSEINLMSMDFYKNG